MKRLLTFSTLLFLIGSVLYGFTGSKVMAPSRTDSLSASHTVIAPTSGLVVYYFDMGKDCSTCLQLEGYAHETLKTYFPEALDAGGIRWEKVDVDQAENDHYVEQFGLYTKSVVIATFKDGEIVRFDNLSRIWELVYDKAAYIKYVRGEVDEALGSAS